MKRNLFFAMHAVALSCIVLFPHCVKNSMSPSDHGSNDSFLIHLNAIDSTGYCHQEILPGPSNIVMCSETLHRNDTAGAVIFSCDTEDAVFPIPAGFYMYKDNIAIDTSGCNSNGCNYWVKGIQVDLVVKWDFGYICSFLGHPNAVLLFVKSSKVAIGFPDDTVTIKYRDSISTPAGATRTNLLWISREVAMQNIRESP